MHSETLTRTEVADVRRTRRLVAAEVLRMRTLLEEMLAEHTGQPIEKVHEDTDRDFVMSAHEAKDYGIIDEVIVSRGLVDNNAPITAVRP